MRCFECQHENREGARFCEACGSKLAWACPACRNLSRPEASFCDRCGTPFASAPPDRKKKAELNKPIAAPPPSISRKRQTPASGRRIRSTGPIRYTPPHLAESILAEQAAMEARAAVGGERKTVTALFADIQGSMAVLEALDPEEARRLIDPVLEIMMEAVHRYEGFVAQTLGDGIFALFGAPIAHEDDPQRALYAALRMQEEGRRYGERLRSERGIALQVRVGINTGEVVMRSIRKDDLHTDYVPVGYSTGLAARLQNLALPGSILVTGHTHRLTDGYFQFEPLGETQVQGVNEPVTIYELRGVGPWRTKLQVAARRGLAPFVGRQEELERMERALELAAAGRGQIVSVRGEPGVGKSRLCLELKRRLPGSWRVLETFSVSHGKALAYLPLIELLKSYFALEPQDDERRVQEKVAGSVLALDRSLEDTLPYVLALLGLSASAASLQSMAPSIRRERTFEAITRLLVRDSLNQPLLIFFGDLHWLDGESLAFLDVLAEGVAAAHILLLTDYRTEYQPGWDGKRHYTPLRLDPLGPGEARDFLDFLLGRDDRLNSLKQLILEKTQGNPFFLEEIVQAMFDQGALARRPGPGPAPGEEIVLSRPLPALRIPPTVQGVLAARIDRLPAEEKALLQNLAVIGKEFSLELLKKVVAERPPGELHRILRHLEGRELLREQPASSVPTYGFKHALTQEVGYGSLLLERRAALHERTARAIEDLFGDRLEEQYGELAHHYSRSQNTEKAVEYLLRAGKQAVQRSAPAEAIDQLTRGLALLKTLPDTVERARQELEFETALGPAWRVTRGFGAPEVEQAYGRARELCQQMGETPQLFSVLCALCEFYNNRAEFQTAQQLGEQSLDIARHAQDRALLLRAHTPLGHVLFFLGEFESARAHFEEGIALYDAPRHRSLALLYGRDLAVSCQSMVSCPLWVLGFPDQALRNSYEALSLARELRHPANLATALGRAAVLRSLRREWQACQECAEAAIALCSDQGLMHYLAVGTMLQGRALVEQGRRDEGIAQMHRGLTAYQATGAKIVQPYYMGLLAEGYWQRGQGQDGLKLVAEALVSVHETGERAWEAELHRLKGELMRGLSDETQAEACFLQAIDVARAQRARAWELRAATSLARLWRERGRGQDARRRLAEVYGWFTEGFDTPDLQQARLLLASMA